MDVFGGEAKAEDALSSLLYSSASSFCALQGCKNSAPPSSSPSSSHQEQTQTLFLGLWDLLVRAGLFPLGGKQQDAATRSASG